MTKIEFGEIVVLEDGKEFVCFGEVEEEGQSYVYLFSNYKPLEVRFARQFLDNGELKLEIVQDQQKKLRLYNAFKEKKS